jgi:tetratricopeptide (TPR) repeat protein
LFEAGTIAREHGWGEYVARAAQVYGWLMTPGESDTRSRDLARSALEVGVEPAWRPSLLAHLAGGEISEGDFDEGIAHLEQAIAAAEDPAATPGSRFSVAMANINFLQGMPDVAAHAQAAAALEAAAREVGNSTWLAFAHYFYGTVAMRTGDRAELERQYQASRVIYANNPEQPDLMIMDAAIALIDGRFDDSDRLAIETMSTVDAASGNFVNATAQLAAGLYWRGRDEELLSAIEAFPVEQWPQRYLLDFVGVSLRARRGERDPKLSELAADNFACLPVGFHRSGCLAHAGSAAGWLGDAELAAQLIDRIEPYAGTFLVAPLGSLVFDAADSVLGLLLLTLGRIDEAVGCYEAAAELCERAGNVPHGTMNKQRLARALLTRDAPGDRERARTLATDALTRATALGLAPDVRFAQAVLDEL